MIRKDYSPISAKLNGIRSWKWAKINFHQNIVTYTTERMVSIKWISWTGANFTTCLSTLASISKKYSLSSKMMTTWFLILIIPMTIPILIALTLPILIAVHHHHPHPQTPGVLTAIEIKKGEKKVEGESQEIEKNQKTVIEIPGRKRINREAEIEEERADMIETKISEGINQGIDQGIRKETKIKIKIRSVTVRRKMIRKRKG